MNVLNEYVESVVGHIPPCLSQRERIAADLRSHLADRVEAGDAPDEAVARMGPPSEVARELLAEVPLAPASLTRRVGAFLIDLGIGLLVTVPLAPVVVALVTGGGEPPLVGMGPVFHLAAAMGVAIILQGLIYFPVLEAVYGWTPGKRALGLCVVRESYERVGWGAAYIRRASWYLELFWADALLALFTEKNQRALDLVAKTLVVRTSA